MGFEANRQQVFSKRIVDLPDQPDMSARDLKAYFDSSAEELRQSFNGLCDALIDFSAAAKMGYRESAGVPAQTVQGAIENVQKQVRDASVGKLPSGCVAASLPSRTRYRRKPTRAAVWMPPCSRVWNRPDRS